MNTNEFSPPDPATRAPEHGIPDPHADFRVLHDNPCLHKWPAPYSWRPHLCIWGRYHQLPHRCECGQEVT